MDQHSQLITRWNFSEECADVGQLYDACEDRVIRETPFNCDLNPHENVLETRKMKFIITTQGNELGSFELSSDEEISQKMGMINNNAFGRFLLDLQHDNRTSMSLICIIKTKAKTLNLMDQNLQNHWKLSLPRSANHIIKEIHYGALAILNLSYTDGSNNLNLLEEKLKSIQGYLKDPYNFKISLPNFSDNIDVNFCVSSPESNSTKSFEESIEMLVEMRTSQKNIFPIRYVLAPLHQFPHFSQVLHHSFYPINQKTYQAIVKLDEDIKNYKKKLIFVEKLDKHFENFLKPKENPRHIKEDFKNHVVGMKKNLRAAIIEARSSRKNFDSEALLEHPRIFQEIDTIFHKIDYLCQLYKFGVKFSLDENVDRSSVILLCNWENLENFRAKFDQLVQEKLRPCVFLHLDTVPNKQMFPSMPGLYVFKGHNFLPFREEECIQEFTSATQAQLQEFTVTPPTKPIVLQQNGLRPQSRVLSPQDEEDVTNILLLGETGVGKSTFLNGLVNFFAYRSFDDALNAGNLLFLTPSTFTIQDKNGIDHTVRIGDAESEDILRSERGGSCTSSTQSYLLKTLTQKIRIIDTPGMGDSAGVARDDENFQNILDFVSKFDKIHGICILLKPNDAKITLTFRYCINELLSHLHTSAASNIIFCFTKSRQTFYRPGNSLPMLRAYIKRVKEDEDIDINVSRETMYCFDNEAFKYICAKTQEIQLGEDEITSCQNSWVKSKEEFERLFNHVDKLTPHQIKDSVTLNNARRVIIASCKPLIEISSEIQLQVHKLQTTFEEIIKLDENQFEISKYLHKKRVVKKPYLFPKPTWFCEAVKCRHYEDKDGIRTRIYYLENRCDDFWEKQKDTSYANRAYRRVKSCLTEERCGACGCKRSEHEKTTEIFVESVEEFVDKDLERKLNENSNRKNDKAIICQHIVQQIDQLKGEREKILKYVAQFANFLKAKALMVSNDAVEDNLIHAINEERLLLSMGGGSYERIAGYEKNLAEYQSQLKIMQECNSLDTGRVLTPSEIMQKIEELKNLHYFGQEIRSMFDAAMRSQEGKARDEEYVYDFS